MGIVPPSSGNPWRNPHEGRPLATTRQNSQGDHEVTVRPGADAADVVSALGNVPENSIFTEHYGDVTVILVFRAIPGAPAVVTPASPTGRSPDPLTSAVPTGPIDREPFGLPTGRYEDALRRAFDGVDLGDYDEQIIRWLATWDSPTVTTVASLVHRARQAGRLARLSS